MENKNFKNLNRLNLRGFILVWGALCGSWVTNENGKGENKNQFKIFRKV